jgi:glycosyltransferase involved in cell wall biosynthesis
MKTWKILKKEQPAVLFVQNPSIVLAFIALFFKKIFSIRYLVVDAHNAGIYPLEGRFWLLNQITKYIVKNADVIIVTNKSLLHYVTSIGGNPVEIPDPLPILKSNNIQKEVRKNVRDKLRATFICTWADDEPYDELIKAAAEFKDLIDFYITGKFQGKVVRSGLPNNVVLSGYVEDKEYINLLVNSDFIIVLTKRENCLNCGAYESVSLGKPIILSDSDVLRNYFSSGVVYSKNDAYSLKCGIRNMVDTIDEKNSEIKNLKISLEEQWAAYKVALEDHLSTCR